MNLLIITNTFLEFATVIIIFRCILGTDLYLSVKNTLYSIIIFIVQMVLQFLLFNTYKSTIPNLFAIFFILLILFNETILYKFCWLAVYVLAEATVAFMLSNFLYLCKPHDIILKNILGISDNITFILFIVCSLILYRKNKQVKQFISCIDKSIYYLMIFSVIIIYIILLFSQFLFYNVIVKTLGCIITLLIFIFILIFFVITISFLRLQYRNTILNKKDKINQKCLEMEQAFNKQIEQKNNDLRAFRHDFNSHMLTLQVLVQDEKWEQVKNYLSKLSIIHTQNFYISTGNIIADAVTNQFYNTLDNNILFKTSGYFKQDCFIDGIDICTILSNLLNNALEALSHLKDNIKKEIYLDIDDTKNRISILMQNSSVNYDGIDTCNIQTTKTDTINHGYGLLNIKNTIEKYHGLMKIHCHNNIFTTFIILNKPLPL